jgi:uncharacterized membrane protein
VSVLLPGAPEFRSGALCYVDPERVTPVEIGLKDLRQTFQTLGRESGGLSIAELLPE